MPNIVWKTGNYGGHAGFAGGKIQLVSLSWHTKRTDPSWLVSTSLPIVIPEDLKGHDDKTTAEQMAEELVRRFLNTIGACWK
jgi:hypothetical protein